MSRVARIAVHHFRHALERPVTTVMGPLAHRPAILVEVEAEDGARGWGEVWCNFPPDGDLHRARMAANVLPSALSGLDTRKPFETFDHVRARLHRLAIQAGEPGPVDQVAAAADIAVHDLAARREGVSLARHLGGEARDVPAYASGIAPDAFGAQMERMRGLGYARFKLRIGFGPGEGLDALDGAAASLGPGERLIADANQAWSVEEALERLPRLAAHDLAWLEEPVPADTPWEGWRRLADEAAMPLAGGENLRGHDAFDRAISAGALGVVQPDICKWGGLSGASRVARAAIDAGLAYCPHFLGGGIGLVASAHLLASVGGPGWLEVDSSENPLLEHFSDHRLTLGADGFRLPTGPGLGFEPDIAGALVMRVSHEVREVAP